MISEADALLLKYALEALETVGAGLPGKTLMDQVERSAHRVITTLDRKRILKLLEDREWAYTYRDPITDIVMYSITTSGKTAMFGL